MDYCCYNNISMIPFQINLCPITCERCSVFELSSQYEQRRFSQVFSFSLVRKTSYNLFYITLTCLSGTLSRRPSELCIIIMVPRSSSTCLHHTSFSSFIVLHLVIIFIICHLHLIIISSSSFMSSFSSNHLHRPSF